MEYKAKIQIAKYRIFRKNSKHALMHSEYPIESVAELGKTHYTRDNCALALIYARLVCACEILRKL